MPEIIPASSTCFNTQTHLTELLRSFREHLPSSLNFHALDVGNPSNVLVDSGNRIYTGTLTLVKGFFGGIHTFAPEDVHFSSVGEGDLEVNNEFLIVSVTQITTNLFEVGFLEIASKHTRP